MITDGFSGLTIIHTVRAPVGGVFRHISDLARWQSERGHHVGIICDSTTGPPLEEQRIDRLAEHLHHGVIRLPMRREIGPKDAATAIAIIRQCRALAPDIIHGHGSKGGVFARITAIDARIAGRHLSCFYSPHGGSLHFEPSRPKGRMYFTVERFLERATTSIIHVSNYEAGVYREKVGRPDCGAWVIHNGLHVAEFEPVTPGEDAVDFLCIGEVRELKGTDVFIDALTELHHRGVGATALIVGDGPEDFMVRCRKRVRDRNLGASIRFRASMPARNAFAMAKSIIVPSRAESLPYVILEAAAAAVPMVATRAGGIPEIFADQASRLISPGDPIALAEAMAAMMQEPDRFQAEANVRAQELKRSFRLDDMARAVDRLYKLSAQVPRPMAGNENSLKALH